MSWGAAHAMCMTWHMHAPRAHHSCTPASRPEAHLRRTHQTKAQLRSEGVAFTGASEPRMPGVIQGFIKLKYTLHDSLGQYEANKCVI